MHERKKTDAGLGLDNTDVHELTDMGLQPLGNLVGLIPAKHWLTAKPLSIASRRNFGNRELGWRHRCILDGDAYYSPGWD